MYVKLLSQSKIVVPITPVDSEHINDILPSTIRNTKLYFVISMGMIK